MHIYWHCSSVCTTPSFANAKRSGGLPLCVSLDLDLLATYAWVHEQAQANLGSEDGIDITREILPSTLDNLQDDATTADCPASAPAWTNAGLLSASIQDLAHLFKVRLDIRTLTDKMFVNGFGT